ncbi:unnamed protein product [Diatraea saccharalis]|uniref:Rad60/SUMO-like domain-containing protein n=1 Tax=Diatraea saccharalis TaxID=40085 RepID=A0A9N9RBD2_9NEOP|nr:unnamed protein product [Diatraea saccharalis]
MDSSDSEDDCYGNIAQKLQSMKNKYTEDKIDSTNLLNDSTELDELVKKAKSTLKNNSEPLVDSKQSDECSAKVDSEDNIIDAILASSSRRITRSTKRKSSNISITENISSKRRAPQKSSVDPQSENSAPCNNIVMEHNATNQSRRSRGRGRNRSRRTWLSTDSCVASQNVINPNIPTYSIGNTAEYPDQSDSQALFSTKVKSNDVVIIDDNELEENEELSVKVYWQSSEFFKFIIRRYQKLTQIFDYFAKKENVSNDQLFFTFNDKILKPDDTPDSINYSIVKFIDGGIVNQSISKLATYKDKEDRRDGIKLKFQCQNMKKPFDIVVSLDEKFSIVMMKCAERLEIPLDRLKFEFDGDSISGKSTPKELCIQEDECIDIKIKC